MRDLVTWFYQLMRKDENWGFKIMDMKYDPLLPLKVIGINMISPAYPLGNLSWESLERVNMKKIFYNVNLIKYMYV